MGMRARINLYVMTLSGSTVCSVRRRGTCAFTLCLLRFPVEGLARGTLIVGSLSGKRHNSSPPLLQVRNRKAPD